MYLTREGIRKDEEWKKAGIDMPTYNIDDIAEKARDKAKWIHFGIGNIFRVFIAGIADELLRNNLLDRGITCVETFDEEVIDRIYRPYDNLSLSVILNSDGSRKYKVIASIAESIKMTVNNSERKRFKEVFSSPDLELVSFTITEKGYSLQNPDSSFLPYILKDIENGPENSFSAMATLTSGLLERYKNGAYPVALVSMDNCKDNGLLLKSSVLTMAKKWEEKGFVDSSFINYLSSPDKVSYVCTMIDKITPRPNPKIAEDLKNMGIEGMDIIETKKRTYIAPFVNAEGPEYLVFEDDFPNGRPKLESVKGVFKGDYETVRKSERMKVTACLNPVHSATGPLGVVLGIESFASMLNTMPEIMKMAKMVAYDEGMAMVEDPKIISPKAFTDELFSVRFPNEYLGDTNLRLSTDVSQGVGVRFGVTISSYKKKYGSAERLVAIPLGIASWIRYMMGIDDLGNKYELAPDPMNDEFRAIYSTITFGDPDSIGDKMHPILSNKKIFFCDLYECGVGKKIETMLKEMNSGIGSVRRTINKYMG